MTKFKQIELRIFVAEKQNEGATVIFNAIEHSVNLNNVELRNAAVQDALAPFESEHAALKEAAQMLIALVEYKEGEDNGGEGITSDDWREANRIIRTLAAVREQWSKPVKPNKNLCKPKNVHGAERK